MVWPEMLSQTPWLINKSAGGPLFSSSRESSRHESGSVKVQVGSGDIDRVAWSRVRARAIPGPACPGLLVLSLAAAGPGPPGSNSARFNRRRVRVSSVGGETVTRHSVTATDGHGDS